MMFAANIDRFRYIRRFSPAILATLLHGFLLYAVSSAGDQFGMPVFEPQPLNLVIGSYFLVFSSTLLLSFLVPADESPTRIAYYLYFLFAIVPMITLYALGFSFASPRFLAYILLAFFTSTLCYRIIPSFSVPRIPQYILTVGLFSAIACGLVVFGYLIASGGFSRFNLDLHMIYEVRAAAPSDAPALLDYLIPWQGYVINMFLLVYFLLRRSHLGAVVMLFVQLLLFGTTNYKAFLLAPALVLALYYLRDSRLLFPILSLVCAVVPLISIAAFRLFDLVLVPSLFIRRLFFVPATNHYLYYDFFVKPENPFILLSNSVFSIFSAYPYDMPVTRVISWNYYGREGGPNVGYLADAYCHFGLAGMLVFGILLAVACKATDRVAERVPTNVASAIIAIPAMAMVNSGFLTSLLTHGFLAAIIAIWILSSGDSAKSSVAVFVKSLFVADEKTQA